MTDPARTAGGSRQRVWTVRSRADDPRETAAAERLASALGVSPLTARLLLNRGLSDPETARRFLEGGARVWRDPCLMADMGRAVARTWQAVGRGERIAVYGDYDADGVTSVACLCLYLTRVGGRVVPYIPDRRAEGYGLSEAAVERLAGEGVTLIVTVDTGVTARAEIARAAALGVDTVVTDHHECPDVLPACAAVVNPCRPDCPYPFKGLAGVGVACKFLCALEAARSGLSADEAYRRAGARFMDLAAIGTVADVMPLEDENRFIVSEGLRMLNRTARPGLAALLRRLSDGASPRPLGTRPAPRPLRRVDEGLVGYGIAPRLNAAGRVGDARLALSLLLADDPARAEALADGLCDANDRRKAEENRIAEEAYARVEALRAEAAGEGRAERRFLVLDDDRWARGVVGIVASRLTDAYGLPSLLITFDGAVGEAPSGEDVGKGSGRSVPGLNLVEALASCGDLLLRFGGHEMAAGLTVLRRNVPALRARLDAYAAARLTPDMTAIRREAECEAGAGDLSEAQVRELERLGPFGAGNPVPLFLLREALLERVIPLSGGRHTKLLLSLGGSAVSAVWFGVSPAEVPAQEGERADLLAEMTVNEFRGARTVQLIARDMRLSASGEAERRRALLRLAEVLNGAPIPPDEDIVPTRDDMARIFRILRGGSGSMPERALYRRLNAPGCAPVGYVKMRLSLLILSEMGVLELAEPEDGILLFDIRSVAGRVAIDASPLMRRLRAQLSGAGA